MKTIVTHPGSAHKDDFLACSLLAAEFGLPIERRDPVEADLLDPEIVVVDVGERHEPELMNFDHHQFAPDRVPTCALSLVLQYLEVYQDARKFCPWLETAEWLDARGAHQTAKWLKVEPFVVAQLSSPIDFSLLRYFAAESLLTPDHAIWKIMRDIGADLLAYIRTLRAHINEVQSHVAIWKVKGINIAYLPRVEGMSPEVAGALNMYIRELDQGIAATATPDRRGDGFGLTRFNDDLRFDFTRVGEEDDVHFAHRQGFVAKTSATDPERLKALLAQSIR